MPITRISFLDDANRPKVITFGGAPLVKWHAFRRSIGGENLHLVRESNGVFGSEVKILEPVTPTPPEAEMPGIVVSDFVVDPNLEFPIYQQEIDVVNSGALANGHQVRVKLDTQALIAAGKMHANRKVKFLDSVDTELDYWMEDHQLNKSETVYWVRYDVPAGTSTIRAEYSAGADYSPNEASGDTVFEFFDDFEDASIDLAKWTVTGVGFGESGGDLTGGVNDANYIRSIPTFNSPAVVTTLINEAVIPANGYTTIGFFNSSTDGVSILSHNVETFYRNDGVWSGPHVYNPAGIESRDEVWMTGSQARVIRDGSDGQTFDSGLFANTQNSETVFLGARHDLSAYAQTYDAKWRFVHVRKYNADVSDGTLTTETETGTAIKPEPDTAYIYFISDGVLWRIKVTSSPIGEEPVAQSFDRSDTRKDIVRFTAGGSPYRAVAGFVSKESLLTPTLFLGDIEGSQRELFIKRPGLHVVPTVAINFETHAPFNLLNPNGYEIWRTIDRGVRQLYATVSYKENISLLVPAATGTQVVKWEARSIKDGVVGKWSNVVFDSVDQVRGRGVQHNVRATALQSVDYSLGGALVQAQRVLRSNTPGGNLIDLTLYPLEQNVPPESLFAEPVVQFFEPFEAINPLLGSAPDHMWTQDIADNNPANASTIGFVGTNSGYAEDKGTVGGKHMVFVEDDVARDRQKGVTGLIGEATANAENIGNSATAVNPLEYDVSGQGSPGPLLPTIGQDFTAYGWFLFKSGVTQDAGATRLLTGRDRSALSGGSNAGFEIFRVNPATTVRLRVEATNGTQADIDGGTIPTDDGWHMVAATFENATGTWTLYVDGQPVNSSTQAGWIGADFLDPLNEDHAIGGANDAADEIAGRVDEAGVWKSRLMSAREIEVLYNHGFAGKSAGAAGWEGIETVESPVDFSSPVSSFSDSFAVPPWAA